MSEPTDRLSKEDLERTLQEKVLPKSRLDELTSHETPKAIVLAGQPGAGKGALVRMAREEFRGDILVIDPDEQRERLPGVRRLQESDPFGWPKATNTDAFKLATGLRDEGIKRHVNLVIDGSMSDAGNSIRTIDALQKNGYEVEVRAISTHWLESEQGIDRRFARQIDRFGVARDVDMDFHNRVYNDLPGNMEKVAEARGVQVRIYDRELNELYDNRRDVGSPSEVLRETRAGRMEDPEVRQRLSEDWKQQQAWHEAMPETIRARQDISPTTVEALIAGSAERGKLERATVRAESIGTIDAPVQASEPLLPRLNRAGTTAGLAGVAMAAAVYDAKETGERISTAFSQDNPSAVRSEATHFTARGVGAAAAMFTPAAVGVSGGPAVALAVADGYLLTEAFDRGAKFLDVRKITHQTASDGADYDFNGKQWIREDLRADFRDDGVQRLQQQDFAARPEIERELNAKASAEAVKQAIGTTNPRDPFEQPANASDAPSTRPGPWRYEAQSGEWARTRYEEIDPTDPRLADREIRDVATAERAAELNRQALETIDRNIVEGPAVLAAQYQIGAKRSGFGDFGAEPDAVATALSSNTLEASNGKQYVRDAQGQWSNNGSPATGSLALELEATRERLGPVLAQHQQQLADTKSYEAPTPEQRDRAQLRLAYTNEGWNPSPEQFEASYLAVKRTRQMSDATAENTGLVLEKDADGQTSLSSPILHTRQGSNNEVQVAAKTYPDEIEVVLSDVRARGLAKGATEQAAPVHAIEQATTEQRDVREQVQREASRAGLSQDETQGAVRVAVPAISGPGGRNGKSEEPDRAPQEEAKPARNGAMLLDNPAHQNHAMYATLLGAVNERDKQLGREPDEISRQLAGGLVEKARERGLDTIGAAKFTPDGTKVGMTDTADLSAPWAKTAVGDVGQLAGQKLSQSSENVAALNQQQALEQSLKQPAPTQGMDGPEGPAPKGPRLV